MILKLGSKGPEVAALQTFLNLNADGSFGPKTEAAVKQWQSQNGLVPDGVVGPKTIAMMGLLDTDKQAVPALDLKKYFMPVGEYIIGPTDKDWIFLHHTAGWQSPYQTIDGWKADARGPVGTEFVLGGQSIRGTDIQFDGELVQAFPQGGYGWHLGIGNSEMHRCSVGIEICNFGYLEIGGYHKFVNGKMEWIKKLPGHLYNYVGTEAHENQVVELKEKFRGHKFWHAYSEKQIEKLKLWIQWVADRDGINPKKGLVELIHRVGAHKAFDTCDPNMCAAQKGLWLHTNVVLGKVDLFPQQEVVDMLVSL